MKQLRVLLWGLGVCGALWLALPVAADDTKGAPKFMWIDKNGERHYGDSVPPEYAQGETHTLNGQGVELKHQEGVKNAQQQAEQTRREQDAAQREQHDRALVATYASTKDIERVRDERLQQLDGQIKATSAYIATLNTRLGALQDRAMHFKPYNTKPEARKMPDDLAEELVRTTNQMRTQHTNLDSRVQEQGQIRAQFAADIARFQELTAQSAR
ncbi:MAG TPA: hypothetical protein VF848_08540 [Steroidobacteraceae bacterium]